MVWLPGKRKHVVRQLHSGGPADVGRGQRGSVPAGGRQLGPAEPRQRPLHDWPQQGCGTAVLPLTPLRALGVLTAQLSVQFSICIRDVWLTRVLVQWLGAQALQEACLGLNPTPPGRLCEPSQASY